MRYGDRLRRTVAVFGENEIRFSPTWIVAIKGVGSMQQDDNVGILFQRIVQTNAIGDEIVCAAYSPIENMLISNAGDLHDGVPVRVASRQLMDRSIFDPRLRAMRP